ncbi:MAG: T9SS type A sorting domain-containing protein [Ignavibacteria bacterium]
MRNMIFIFCCIFIFAGRIQSQENFEYPTGDSLYQHWGYNGPLVFGPYKHIIISSPSLSFPLYTGSTLGNSVMLDTVDIEILKTYFHHFGIPSGNAYFSFIARVGAAKPLGERFINTGGSLIFNYSFNSFGGVFVKDSSGKIAFGIAKDTETPVYTPAVYNRAVNYLIIYKYSFIDGGTNNDSLSLFVFPSASPSVEPAPLVKISPSSPDFPDIGSAWLYQGLNSNSPRIRVDGIYLMNSWDNTVLPIELSNFNASVDRSNVNLNWTVVSEINNSGFDIERRSAVENISWNKIGFVEGRGTTNEPNTYIFKDANLEAGSYQYRLKQTDFNGNFEYFTLENEVMISIPIDFSLGQNYPNPFNPVSKIDFAIPVGGLVTLKVYDILGKEVTTLVNEVREAGFYSVKFDGTNLSSGVYFYSINVDGGGQKFSKTLKLVLSK